LLGPARHFGYTCEDEDRKLESGGEKIPGKTAIPRGYYRLTADVSKRFGRLMPILRNVPQFTGVRVHGGNTAEDTEGCPLLGKIRTTTGVKNCKEANEQLLDFILGVEAGGDQVWVEVK
jgi:hypothetical protein